MSWIISIASTIAVLGGIAFALRHDRQSLDDVLGPELARHGLTLVSSRPPHPFEKRRPPHGRWRVTVAEPEAFGRRGEQDHVRVVTVRDGEGRLHVVWARILLTAFEPARIEWRPPLSELGGSPRSPSVHAA